MPDTREWTLMFYLASDNPLAISMVSQLKALKAAGYHSEANVIAQFDPFTEGTPTHIFDVNLINKKKDPDGKNIGFADQKWNGKKNGFGGNDTFVRNLIEDKLWRYEKSHQGRSIRQELKKLLKTKHGIKYDPPVAPSLRARARRGRRRSELDPYLSLERFLEFGRKEYPAKRYMLFMVGHGVVVGNEMFMYDEHAENKSITLNQMGSLLRSFKTSVNRTGATFELVSFHSCSVSSMEVAYELQDTANYMLASQGPTFVGSWPYRQILMRIFNELEARPGNPDVKEILSDIFYYCLHNSADFLLAGYSYQLTLCDLGTVSSIKNSMQKLSRALIRGLGDPASKYCILYAHWKAQSFFQEMYTDLYDFCFCISERCRRIREGRGKLTPQLKALDIACNEIMDKLAKPKPANGKARSRTAVQSPFLVSTEFAGPAYQYSHGMSVYFPWNQPSDDSQILDEYATYEFHKQFRTSWLNFLEAYFEETQRGASRLEKDDRRILKRRNAEKRLEEELGSLVYNGEGPLGSGNALAKGDPTDRTGGDCDCPSFKNYPRDTRSRRLRTKRAVRLPVSSTLLGS